MENTQRIRQNSPDRAFESGSFGGLSVEEELEVRRRWDFNLKLELELKRRQMEEASQASQNLLDDRYKAFASAMPLAQYIHEVFPLIEQGRAFKSNWHIFIIAEVLQAATLGDIRNFIINIPRRTMKSLLVCVIWQTWVWTFLPQSRWVFTSYSANFAKRDNEKCKNLIKTAYYQQRWGDKVQLTVERTTKIENTAGGFRTVFKIGKGVGEGGDFVIADDPNSIDEVESDTVIEKTNNGWNEVSYHNVTDRNTAIRAIIQQRTAHNDVTGFITDDPELKQLYILLCLPMKYDPEHPNRNCKENPLRLGKVNAYDKNANPELEIGEEKLWIDPRDLDAPNFDNKWYQFWYKKYFLDTGHISKGQNQLLWESYITEDVVKQEVAHLKAHGEHSQFQQLPTRRGGNFFNSAHFLVDGKPINVETLDLNEMDFCRFWDKAGSDNTGDWTVGVLVASTRKKPNAPRRVYIIDIIRVQRSLYNRMELIERTAKQDVEDYVEMLNDTSYCIGIEVEPASSGKDIATIERDALLGYDVRTRKPKGSKSWRAQTPKNASENGRLKICRGDWNAGFLSRLEKFNPNKNTNKDDEFDALSGAMKEVIFNRSKRGGSKSGV